MQQLTDLRRQMAATAAIPFGLNTWWERVFAGQVLQTGGEVATGREKFDMSRWVPLQDPDPTSGTYGKFSQAFLDRFDMLDPFNGGPL